MTQRLFIQDLREVGIVNPVNSNNNIINSINIIINSNSNRQ